MDGAIRGSGGHLDDHLSGPGDRARHLRHGQHLGSPKAVARTARVLSILLDVLT
jgi:hypothetical protein